MCFGGNDETPAAGATLYRGPGDSTVKYPQSGEVGAPRPIQNNTGNNASSAPASSSRTGLAIPSEWDGGGP